MGEHLAVERTLLTVLPEEPFDAGESTRARVSQKSLVPVRQKQCKKPSLIASCSESFRTIAASI
ncbi:MAG: hypothetical protein HYX29_07305 [Solirubrobacterales bacterium]|nr:hypothetical protein [Solirubrobacterales bacterium]